MYEYQISEKLNKILKKLFKKDKIRYEASIKKIEEIISCKDLSHYKNLRYDFSEYKRVHIDSHFVLIFKLNNNKITFITLKHHDDIYQR